MNDLETGISFKSYYVWHKWNRLILHPVWYNLCPEENESKVWHAFSDTLQGPWQCGTASLCTSCLSLFPFRSRLFSHTLSRPNALSPLVSLCYSFDSAKFVFKNLFSMYYCGSLILSSRPLTSHSVKSFGIGFLFLVRDCYLPFFFNHLRFSSVRNRCVFYFIFVFGKFSVLEMSWHSRFCLAPNAYTCYILVSQNFKRKPSTLSPFSFVQEEDRFEVGKSAAPYPLPWAIYSGFHWIWQTFREPGCTSHWDEIVETKNCC